MSISRHWLLVVVAYLLASCSTPAIAQVLTNEALLAAVKEATLVLESKLDTGDLVLREEYFKEKSEELHKIEKSGMTTHLSLRDSQRLVLAVTEVAKAMLKVAEPDRANPAAYLSAWNDEEKLLLIRLGGPPGTVLLTPELMKIWDKFLTVWREDVVRIDAERFRDALRQAAYSLLRVGLDIEEEWIKKVREGGLVTGSGTQRFSSGDAGVIYMDRPPGHLYRSHHRKMHRIISRYR